MDIERQNFLKEIDQELNPSKTSRETAMNWWNSMTFEEKFYKTIKHNDLIAGDKTRHPSTLTGREIETIYKAEKKI